MSKHLRHRRARRSLRRGRPRLAIRRSGTTAVEAAFVLPVFFFFLLALIEFGHAQMVNNTLRSACRTAARLGSTEGQTTADVEAHVQQVLGAAIDVGAVEVLVKDGQTLDEGATPPTTASEFAALGDIELADADPRRLFLVRASINYNDIALVPMPFMEGVVLDGQAYMRHE